MAKEGSTIGGLMDTIATLVSVALQYGVPIESLVRKFEHVRFEPSGMTRNSEIPFAKSLVDYIFRWLAMEFIPGYRAANAPQREKKQTPSLNTAPAVVAKPTPITTPAATPAPTVKSPSSGTPGEGRVEGSAADQLEQQPETSPPASDLPTRKPKGGNGHHPRLDPDEHKTIEYANEDGFPAPSPSTTQQETSPTPGRLGAMTTVILSDPLSQQGTEMQADAPACDVCGSITVRSGTCYKCLNCGNSMGCS